MPVFNPDFLQAARKDIEIEPGIAPGPRKRSDVNNVLYAVGLKKIGKRLNGMGGLADGENKGEDSDKGCALESLRGSWGKGNFFWEGMAPFYRPTKSRP